MAKTNVEFNSQKRIEAEKSGDKDEKALYKLMTTLKIMVTTQDYYSLTLMV